MVKEWQKGTSQDGREPIYLKSNRNKTIVDTDREWE